jgi:hypothetical protein
MMSRSPILRGVPSSACVVQNVQRRSCGPNVSARRQIPHLLQVGDIKEALALPCGGDSPHLQAASAGCTGEAAERATAKRPRDCEEIALFSAPVAPRSPLQAALFDLLTLQLQCECNFELRFSYVPVNLDILRSVLNRQSAEPGRRRACQRTERGCSRSARSRGPRRRCRREKPKLTGQQEQRTGPDLKSANYWSASWPATRACRPTAPCMRCSTATAWSSAPESDATAPPARRSRQARCPTRCGAQISRASSSSAMAATVTR